MLDKKEIRRKMARRKYLDESCEMSVGWHEDSSGHPVIDMCQSGPVRVVPEYGMFGISLCDEHFEKWLASI